jgi:hypothetical protein
MTKSVRAAWISFAGISKPGDLFLQRKKKKKQN